MTWVIVGVGVTYEPEMEALRLRVSLDALDLLYAMLFCSWIASCQALMEGELPGLDAVLEDLKKKSLLSEVLKCNISLSTDTFSIMEMAREPRWVPNSSSLTSDELSGCLVNQCNAEFVRTQYRA